MGPSYKAVSPPVGYLLTLINVFHKKKRIEAFCPSGVQVVIKVPLKACLTSECAPIDSSEITGDDSDIKPLLKVRLQQSHSHTRFLFL
jgi:hypothetical protein